MNSMSTATHCSMLINSGKPSAAALDEISNSWITAAQHSSTSADALTTTHFDIRMPSTNTTSPAKALPVMPEIPFSTVFYVTHEGLAEIRSGMSSLPSQARRALLMIDGFRNAADLSLRLRGGEAEKILHGLEDRKFIARIAGVGNDADNDNGIADDTSPAKQLSAERLEAIKLKITNDLRKRLGKPADAVLGDVLATIDNCESAIELRGALRKAGDVLIVELGEEGVIRHLRAVGKNVIELIVQED
jgi:hypothetical protein